MSVPGCPKCEGRWPDERYRVAEFRTSIAYRHEDQFFAGWTLLVLKRLASDPKRPVWVHEHARTVPGDAERVDRIARLRRPLGP